VFLRISAEAEEQHALEEQQRLAGGNVIGTENALEGTAVRSFSSKTPRTSQINRPSAELAS
jgi:hypothetical protein